MEIYRLRDELAEAIEAGKWKTAKNRAKGILELLPVALDPATSKTGYPHLDGVYIIGTQKLAGSTDKARIAIMEMNQFISTAKLKLGKKKKKKKK